MASIRVRVGQRIRQIRKAQKMNGETLAKRSGAYSGKAGISQLERGDRMPALEDLEKIAAALNCELVLDLVPRDGTEVAISLPPEAVPVAAHLRGLDEERLAVVRLTARLMHEATDRDLRHLRSLLTEMAKDYLSVTAEHDPDEVGEP